MVDDISTWHQHRRRRRKNTSYYPSAALLASLAAFIPPAVLARPVLLPFLYPSIPQSTSTSSSPLQQQQPAPSRPRQKRSTAASSSTSSFREPTATASQPSASEQRRADRIANHFQPDDTGHYKPACWSLHGQSNCPRDDPINGTIDDPDVHEVVPGQPDFPPTSTSGPSTSTTPPSPTTTSPTSTATASPSATTVEPYTMTFNVSNIPPGWQKNARTSFYSKNLIIGFSVTLAALICLTIVLCVIWRIRVARARRESERALKEKKKELGIASQTSDDTSSIDHDQDRESTRQRGLRRRRANVRAGDEDDDSDDDNDDGDDDGRREGAAMSEKNGMTPSGRKRRTAFMRTFSGKMLTGPTKWRRNKKRRQQEQEEEEEEEARARAEVEEDGERDERQEQSGRRDTTAASIPPPLETQTSFSPLLAQNSTSTTVEAPIPLSPPPPPPVNLQPPPAATSPLRNGEHEDDDDDDPTTVQPPAYRRRNFGLRSRAAPAPTTATPMSARALEKQREAGDVPEEYMYMAGMMPPPLPSSTVVANDAAGLVVERSRSVGLPPVEQDRDDDDEEEDGDEEAVPRREDVTAHLATDDKTVLARLHESGSAPSAPPAEMDALEEGGSHVMPVVPEEVEMYDLEDAQGSASGSSSLPPPTAFLPAPPTITSAHLFVPPPPQSAEHEDGSELPRYVAGPSAPSLLGRSEKHSATADAGPSEPPALLPSAPPAEHDQLAASAAAGLIVPSAPPMVEDGEVQEFVLVPSAPPLSEDEGGAGPSAPK